MGNSLTCIESGNWLDNDHEHISKLYEPTTTKVYQDMTQPMSHYFISSGHNSYLTGNQLNSACGTSTITLCLKQGCRVIELDVYNKSSPFKEPICKHGGTLTKPVSFRDCIKAIHADAFTASEYPVMVTLENHTDPENQQMMAQILAEELKEQLYLPVAGAPEFWASPESLKKRVVVRTSVKPNTIEELKRVVYVANSKFKSFAEMLKLSHSTSSSFEEGSIPHIKDYNTMASDADENTNGNATPRTDTGGSRTASIENGARAKLGRSPSIDGGEAVDTAMTEGSLQEVLSYTSKHLMRVYPAGWRVMSSNYDPMRAWTRGASLAALNWQMWAKPMWTNEGMFMDNGGCGFVLKPIWMLDPAASLPPRIARKLAVTIYSAYKHQGLNICCYRDDLFVQVEIKGVPMDCKKQHTKASLNTGHLVVKQTFEFDLLFPEMAILIIQLKDQDLTGRHDSDSLAYYSLPINTLSQGDFKLPMRHPRVCKREKLRTWVKAGFRWLNDPVQAARGPDMNAITEQPTPLSSPVQAPAAAPAPWTEPAKQATAAGVAVEATTVDSHGNMGQTVTPATGAPPALQHSESNAPGNLNPLYKGAAT